MQSLIVARLDQNQQDFDGATKSPWAQSGSQPCSSRCSRTRSNWTPSSTPAHSTRLNLINKRICISLQITTPLPPVSYHVLLDSIPARSRPQTLRLLILLREFEYSVLNSTSYLYQQVNLGLQSALLKADCGYPQRTVTRSGIATTRRRGIQNSPCKPTPVSTNSVDILNSVWLLP